MIRDEMNQAEIESGKNSISQTHYKAKSLIMSKLL